MSESTTVRVRRSTRDRVNKLAAQRGATVDELILEGLDALERERWRRQAEADARRLSEDPADRAEVSAAIADLTGQ